jgi:hypothetical protein
VTSLAAQQRALAALLQRGSSIADDAEASALATGNARLSAGAQVEIYREQFFLRHVDALREDFGSVAHLLGPEAFEALARAYLAAHPPCSFSLRDLGAALPAFLTDPRTRDLARVDWAFVEAFDAPSLPPLAASDLGSLPEAAWPALRLALQPAVTLLSLAYPAHDYRAAARHGGAPPPLVPRACFVAIYRGLTALHSLELAPAAYAILDHLASGMPLGEACERASRTSPSDIAADLAAWFQQWTARGFLSRPRPEA